MITLEVLTVITWFCIHYVNLWLINSKFFVNSIGPRYLWSIKSPRPWTMTYAGKLSAFVGRYTCQYEGATNEQGFPHGFGRWADDSFHGENLVGWWKDGIPVGPFVSSEYGSGSIFSSLRLVYFLATDDDFFSQSFKPSNTRLPSRCGVASVECSVYGNFFKHLPSAIDLTGPFTINPENEEDAQHLKRCIELLRPREHSGEDEESKLSTRVEVSTDASGFVSVSGHTLSRDAGGGRTAPDTIVVQVVRPNGNIDGEAPQTFRHSMMYASNQSAHNRSLLYSISRGFASADGDENEKHGQLAASFPSDPSHPPAASHCADSSAPLQQEEPPERAGAKDYKRAHLCVQGWVVASELEAVVYFPGFNSNLKSSLQTFGQFVAMADFPRHFVFVVFAWPCGQVPTYMLASNRANSEENKRHFMVLLDSLQSAGISRVHLMSHSLGAQALLSLFHDKSDGSPSEVSLRFRPSCDFEDIYPRNQQEAGPLLKCESVILLNPDFPRDAFVDHMFRSLRRACDLITILGDRHDGALFYSEIMNGARETMGMHEPAVLCSRLPKRATWRRKKSIGRHIDELCFDSNDDKDENIALPDQRYLFRGLAEDAREWLFAQDTHELRAGDEASFKVKLWLDLDVIDGTLLDTNVQSLRHSYFNLNATLSKDIKEIIITKRRAFQRSGLVYRQGNIFSYCQAPTFVVQQ